MKNFAGPKDEDEKKFVNFELWKIYFHNFDRIAKVSQKLAKYRGQIQNLLGQNGVLVTPMWPRAVPFHNMEPFTTFNLPYTIVNN